MWNTYGKTSNFRGEVRSEKDWERPLTHTALKPDTHTHICSELSGIPSQSDMLCWLRLMSWTTIFVNTSVMIWSAIGDSRLWTGMSQDVTEKKKNILNEPSSKVRLHGLSSYKRTWSSVHWGFHMFICHHMPMNGKSIGFLFMMVDIDSSREPFGLDSLSSLRNPKCRSSIQYTGYMIGIHIVVRCCNDNPQLNTEIFCIEDIQKYQHI